jgi:hypothetical protein
VGGNGIVPVLTNSTDCRSFQIHAPRAADGPTGQAAAIGSIKLGSLFLTLPTRALTGQQIISSEG